MTIRFACPDCGRQFQLPDDAAGKRENCPDCGRAIDVPVLSSIVRFLGRIFGDGLASAPILVGRFALFFCWVPVLGVMMAVPLAFIGIAIGVLGFPVGLLRNRKAMMRSLGGIGLCVLAIIGSTASSGALIAVLKYLPNQAGPREQRQVPVLAPGPPRPRENRVMTIDGHPADVHPQVDTLAVPDSARVATSSESTTQRKAPPEKPSGGSVVPQSSTSAGKTRDR